MNFKHDYEPVSRHKVVMLAVALMIAALLVYWRLAPIP
jgi:hypothetical protein